MLLYLSLYIEATLLGHSKGHLYHNGRVWPMEVQALTIVDLPGSIPNVIKGVKPGDAGANSG
jgi:hypothetical protein